MSTNEVKAVLTAEDRNFSSTFQNALNTAEGFGSKLKSGIGFGILMRAGQKAFDAIGSAISTNLSGATKRLDTLNNYPKVMQSLGFSAKQAEASIGTLGDNIAHLPTTLDKVASQTQQVVAVTGDLEKATDLTLALNNAMAGGGASAEQQASAVNQWVQAMAKGKPDMQDWRSLVQTAPAQMDQLAKSMLGAEAGQADLYQAMQDGSVTIDQVNDKMIELTNASEGFDIAGKHYDNFAKQAENASAGIGMALTNVKASIQRNIANVLGALDEKFANLGGLSGIIQTIITPINTLGEAFVGILNGSTTFSEAIDGLLETLGAKAQEFIPKGMEMVGNFLAGIAQQLPSIITSGISFVLDLLAGIAQGLPGLIVKGLEAVTTFIEGIGNGDGQLGSKAIDIVVKLATGILSSLPQILSAGLNLMIALLNGIVQGFASIPGKVLALAQRIPEVIKSIDLVSIGRNMIEGLWNGIKGAFDGVISRVSALASKLPEAVKKVLGISSPSKVFAKIGWYTGEGFAIGIEKSYKQVQSAMQGLYSMQPAGALGGTLAMNDAYSYNVSARYEVIVPVQLNGREIARASAGDMQTALNQREMRANRKVGVR